MTTYEQVVFDNDEKVAITVTNQGKVSQWGTSNSKSITKVFQDNKGNKAVLYLYSHWDFEKEATSAPYCKYKPQLFGDFPYGSWCWAIRKCLVTNEVRIWEICTDINPRGVSSSEQWVNKCKSYVPANVVADLITT